MGAYRLCAKCGKHLTPAFGTDPCDECGGPSEPTEFDESFNLKQTLESESANECEDDEDGDNTKAH